MLGLIVLLVIAAFCVLTYLLYRVKNSHSTVMKRTNRPATARFDHYKTARAKITNVEKVTYYVQPYQYTPEKKEYVSAADEDFYTPTLLKKVRSFREVSDTARYIVPFRKRKWK